MEEVPDEHVNTRPKEPSDSQVLTRFHVYETGFLDSQASDESLNLYSELSHYVLVPVCIFTHPLMYPPDKLLYGGLLASRLQEYETV